MYNAFGPPPVLRADTTVALASARLRPVAVPALRVAVLALRGPPPNRHVDALAAVALQEAEAVTTYRSSEALRPLLVGDAVRVSLNKHTLCINVGTCTVLA